MRTQVVADIHGDVDGLTRALAAGLCENVDALVSIGDVVDCLLSTDDQSSGLALSKVTSWHEALGELLVGAALVRGNQEERIRRAVDPEVIPPGLQRILGAPLVRATPSAVFTHGHTFRGVEVSPDRWVPLDAEFSQLALIHGHHHRSSVVELGPRSRDWSDAVDVTPESDTPFAFRQDRKYLVNVGPAHGAEPSWAIFDDELSSVCLHYAERRPKG